MEKYSCAIKGCGKAYKSESNLNRHLQAMHAKNKRYQCDQCDKYLSSSQNLKEHKLLHSRLLPFVCKENCCGKRFRHASQYSAHKRVHNFIKNGLSTSQLNYSVFTKPLAEVLNPYNDLKSIPHCQLSIKLPVIKEKQEYKLPEL